MSLKTINLMKTISPPPLRRSDDMFKDYVVVKEETRSESKDSEAITAASSGLLAGKAVRKGGSSLPPVRDMSVTVRSHTFRYVSTNGANATNITPTNIIGTCGGICTVANSKLTPWASSFLLKCIRCWPGPSATGYEDVVIRWAAYNSIGTRDQKLERALPLGVTVTGCLEFRPPKGSAATWWQVANSSVLLVISCAPGSILELDVDFTLSNSFITSDATIATGTLASVYYLPLDGATAHTITHLGLPSTF